MKKSIFCVVGIAAIAAFFCVGCGDFGVGAGDGGGGGGGGDGVESGYTLTTTVSPYGAGSVSRNPSQSRYAQGTSVSVMATASGNYVFTGWSGASTSTSSTVTVTMDGNRSITANFREPGANAVIITLTYWATTATDLLDSKLDPRIYFKVQSYQNGSSILSNTTSDLLNADNVGQSWTGSSKSSAISFIETATQLRIEPVVLEKDPLANDDISPGSYSAFTLPVSAGRTGSTTLGSATSTTSRIDYSYEFVRR